MHFVRAKASPLLLDREVRPPLLEPSPEEFLPQLDVAPLHASASNDGVDVGLLAEHGEASLFDVLKKDGWIHPEFCCWEAVRLDQELSNVDRVTDPVLNEEYRNDG